MEVQCAPYEQFPAERYATFDVDACARMSDFAFYHVGPTTNVAELSALLDFQLHTSRRYNEQRSLQRAAARAALKELSALQTKKNNDYLVKLFTEVGRPASHRRKVCWCRR
jgi:hypothetical protein